MMKKIIIIFVLFIVGFAWGVFFNPNSPKNNKHKDGKVSDYNWISRYDLYSYEEEILKKGDIDKLFRITCEASVDRLPYLIVTCDVYDNAEAANFLLREYLLYQKGYRKHNVSAMIPLTNYVKEVVAETSEKGYKFYTWDLDELKKYE
jgi:hypothetical protein